MVKKIKKNTSKKSSRNKTVNKNLKNNNKNNLVFYGLGVISVLILVALVIGLTGSSVNTTGSAIYVESYGVSNKLISDRAGTIQTLIELEQPTLIKLGEQGSTLAQEITNKVTESVNFSKEIENLYQNNPGTSIIPTEALVELKKGAQIGEDDFKNDLTCLNNIGKNYRHNQEFDMVVVSELKYTECSSKFSDKLFAYMKHNFFKKDNSFLCSQESDKLFLITKDSGTINTNTTNC